VQLIGRYRNLQPPQLWKSRFKTLPLILALGFVWILSFVLLFLYFKHKGK
jgi:hypothetical protein